jgi:glycosyltransferase involved in cell wall biosynthesis
MPRLYGTDASGPDGHGNSSVQAAQAILLLVCRRSEFRVRILFDGYWWAAGPHSNRQVLREFILHWEREFPSDELVVAVRRRHRMAARAELPARVELVDSWLSPQGLSAMVELPLLARRVGADLMLTHNFTPIAGRSLVFIHDLLFETDPQWFTAKERAYFSLMTLTAPWASIVATSSASEAARIARVVKLRREVLPVGLGTPRGLLQSTPEPLQSLADVQGFLLVVGRLNVRKNLGVALEGAVRSGRLSPERPIVIVGEASGRAGELPAAVQEAVALGTVRFAGFVTEPQLAWLYRQAELFIFLSLDEGFGIPTLEALHFGTPILASDIPVFREILGQRARFVDPRSAERVAQEVGAALDRVQAEGRPAPVHPETLGYSWTASVHRLRAAAAELIVRR